MAVPANSASYTTTFTLYACRPGDIVVTASLGDAGSASATQSVTIATRTLPASDVCDDGTVVSDHTSNPGLLSDCENLLLAINTLKGAANTALNWSSTRALSDWDGITVRRQSPAASLALELSGRGLAGKYTGGTVGRPSEAPDPRPIQQSAPEPHLSRRMFPFRQT